MLGFLGLGIMGFRGDCWDWVASGSYLNPKPETLGLGLLASGLLIWGDRFGASVDPCNQS